MPPRPLGIQDLLGVLVSGERSDPAGGSGGDGSSGAEVDADMDAAAGASVAGAEGTGQEHALQQLFSHFRDAFGGENCEQPAHTSLSSVPILDAVGRLRCHIGGDPGRRSMEEGDGLTCEASLLPLVQSLPCGYAAKAGTRATWLCQ